MSAELLTAIQPYINLVHQNWAPFMLGAILTHPVLLADLTFKVMMWCPPIKAYMIAHPDKVNEWIDAFQAELEKNIKESSAPDAKKTSETPKEG